MKIRHATNKDAELLSKIGSETFWDTYHTDSHLEQEHIKAHIAKTFAIEQLKSEINQENIVYLIAENDIEEIGYSRLLLESRREKITAEKPLEISRIYLRKKFWGKKFGTILLEECFEEAKKHNCDVIWLSVWQYNKRAIKFYERFEFCSIGEHIFDLAGDSQIDFIMQKTMKEKS